MKDQFGREHDYLRISLTDRCNFRCFYCMPEEEVSYSPGKKLMTPGEIFDIAQEFVALGVNKIRLTGGEPLVRKDFNEILEKLSQLPVSLRVTTNGLLLDQYFEKFKEVGLEKINISLDSLDPAKFFAITKRQNFDRVMGNIQKSIDLGFRVKLNVVTGKGLNENEIFEFVELTKDNPIDVRFIEFMPFLGNKWEGDKVIPYRELYNQIREKHFIKKARDTRNDTSINFRVGGYSGKFGFISSVSHPFCKSCNRLRLMADGKMKNCLFSDEEVDLLNYLRQGQDIKPHILELLHKKEFQHGGKDLQKATSERSMVSIGG